MGQEEALLPAPATMAFSWEHEQSVLKPVSAPAMGARGGMPESPRKAAATVFLPWEQEQGMTKSAVKARVGVPEWPRKAQAPARRLSVPPPPGRPAARSVSRAVRSEDDPFLAAYLACTKQSTGGRGGGGKWSTAGAREPKEGLIRRFTWAGLGLSCKRGDGAVEQSMVRLAKPSCPSPRDD